MWKAAVVVLVGWGLLAPALLRAAPPNVDQQARLYAAWLALPPGERGLAREDEKYARAVTWYAIADPKQRETTKRLFAWWLNQLSFAPAPGFPHDVPGSDGMLQWLDIRDFRWNCDAWAAVAEREPYAQEPWVFRDVADALRSVIGYHVPERLAKKDVFPVVGMVRGDWLLRETLESGRSTSYYDLLFASQRFGGGEDTWRTEKRTVDHPGGDYRYPDDTGRVSRNVKPGRYEVELRYKEKGKTSFVDFPKNKADWDLAFGVDVVRKYQRNADVLWDRGAVVAGNRSDPKAGSIVALNDRIIVVVPTPGGSLETYDFFVTAGNKDPVELAPKVPRLVAENEVHADAGELLSYLPNGGQAALLINVDQKRVEVAATQAANNQIDPRLNPGVRTIQDCIRCHGPEGGLIPPRNLVELSRAAGVDTKFKDPHDREDFEAFFLGWQKRAKAFTVPYLDLLETTTKQQPPSAWEFESALRAKDDVRLKALTAQAGAAKASKGWTGAELAKQVAVFVASYDDPLTPDQVAAEVGAPKDVLIELATKSTGGRAAYFARGQNTPRSVFEADFFRELSLRVTAAREK